ncbi:unnamed protein product [Arctia plantaginis]|uniref:PiggyBac transposable element-derived protein domain-containing protein n=1 Tax=Arctia plantaginis TaxID=874455 RepID=A0A8S0ZHV8_ARCPL|nr:unnamed protein product [Arctia plantaginis]
MPEDFTVEGSPREIVIQEKEKISKKELNKRNKNLGKEYTTQITNKIIPERQLGPIFKTAIDKLLPTGIQEKDRRGGRTIANIQKDDRAKALVEEHLKRFPRVESHYCRANSTREYLHSDLTIRKMHQMLVEDLQEEPKPSLSLYRKLFNCKNLSFHRPKKDQCSLCSTYREGTDDIKANLHETYTTHILQKQSFRAKRSERKQEAQKDALTIACATFDLQQVINLPISNESAVFYKRRLSVYNFTIYEMVSHDCFCYTWHEGQNFKALSQNLRLLSVRKDDTGEMVDWRQMMELSFMKTDPNKFFFKTDHTAENSRSLTLRRQVSGELHSQILPLNVTQPKISQEKYNDLMALTAGDTPVIRLSATERNAYLKKLLGENDSDSSAPSDSDDEDWIPANTARRHQIANHEDNSEHDEPEDSEDTGEIAEGNSEVEEEVENSESEEDDEEVETAEPEGRGAREPSGSFIAKDKTLWSKTPLTQHQTTAHNIVRQRSGPHRSTKMLSISETFKKIFTYEMVDIIVRHTNKKAEATYQHYNADHPDSPHQWKPITIPKTYSFFGILICAGANNSNMDHTFDMWHSNSYPLYRATMGLKRFHNILRFLRFDDSNTRSQRKKKDKAAPIRDVWTMLNSNLAQMYKPTASLTIDEQLYPYRGRTGFTQYIPSKPAKYCIKIWWICDAENAYPLQGIIYTGKTDGTREKNQGERVVKELTSPYRGSGRNVCMDNFFTTLPVAKHLLSWNITIVGTIKKNKPYIPSVIGANKTRKQYSTVFGFHEKVTMCSYVPKKNKAVILLSTMHSDASVDIISKPKRKKQNTDTESEDETDMSLRESSCSPIEEIAEGSDVENETPILTEFVKEKGFILVKFEKKKSVKHNVGQEKDRRGGRTIANIQKDDRAKALVEEHLKRFPRVESHYCRANSTREYLHSDLTIRKMHQMLVEDLQEEPKPSLSLYRKLFNCKNLSFHRPKKDQCSLCSTYREGTDDIKQICTKHIPPIYYKSNNSVQNDQNENKKLKKMH